MKFTIFITLLSYHLLANYLIVGTKLNNINLELISQKLVGSWTSKAWDGTLKEKWVYHEGSIHQTSRYTEHGKILYEAESYIEIKGGELLLITIIKDNNPKIFKAIIISEDLIVFENTEYANPSRVTYIFENGIYNRKIEGIENGNPSTYTFKFTRGQE